MKRLTQLIPLACLLLLFVGLVQPVLAQGSLSGLLEVTAGSAGYDVQTDNENALPEIIGRIVRIFLSFLGVIFVSYTIYGGFLWMTAAGNEEKVAKGKMVITQGVVGMVVILSAYAIYELVRSLLTVAGGSPYGSGGRAR